MPSLQCPIEVFKQSAWTSELLQSMVDIVLGRATMADFVEMVRCARTSHFMKQAAAYRGHVKYYSYIRNSQFVQNCSDTVPEFPPFPSFFQHCDGFNGSLGPCPQNCISIFCSIVQKQQVFFDRFQGALSELYYLLMLITMSREE